MRNTSLELGLSFQMKREKIEEIFLCEASIVQWTMDNCMYLHYLKIDKIIIQMNFLCLYLKPYSLISCHDRHIDFCRYCRHYL